MGQPLGQLAAELYRLAPLNFLDQIPHEQLEQFPRYLKALLIRAERAGLNPQKDAERMGQLQPYLEALDTLQKASVRSSLAADAPRNFR